MKIALVILHADPARGGAERYTIDLASQLAARNHQVALLASSFAANLPVGINPQPMPATKATRLGRYQNFLQLVEAYRSSHPDEILHAMLPVRRCDLYHPHAGIAAQSIRAGTAINRFGNWFNRRRHRMATVEAELLNSPQSPLVLCLSKYVKRTVQEHYPTLNENRLVTLINGVDLQRFDPAHQPQAGTELRIKLGFAAEEVVGLIIAQDFQRKGLRQTIQAMGQISNPHLKLVVVGKDDPTPYQRQVQLLLLQDRVHFVGPTTDPTSFYKAADFFVLPTRHDPCSLVVLEALAMGLPVISTQQNGACEVMTNSIHGFVLPNNLDLQGLTAAMRKMLNPEIRKVMVANCRLLRSSLSQDRHIAILEALYGQVARI